MVFHRKVSTVPAHGYLARGVTLEIEVRRRSCQLVVPGQNAKYVVVSYSTPVFITDTHISSVLAEGAGQDKSPIDRAVELRRINPLGQSCGPIKNEQVLSQILVTGHQIWCGRNKQYVTSIGRNDG